MMLILDESYWCTSFHVRNIWTNISPATMIESGRAKVKEVGFILKSQISVFVFSVIIVINGKKICEHFSNSTLKV